MLKHQYEKQDEIPEAFRELYAEKAGRWELTGVAGIKTQADVDRISAALEKERNEHKEAKTRLGAWSELGELDSIKQTLDRVPELEAASKGKLDEAQIEQLVAKRVDGVLKSRTSPLERQVNALTKERDQFKAQVEQYSARERQRAIHDAVRKAAGPEGEKLLPAAVEDALVLAERLFEVTEDGQVVTRDGVGITPGLGAKDWLAEIRDKRPHWWPASSGGGASGSGARGAGFGSSKDNPWSAEGWNLTAQGNYLRTHGREKAEAAAKAAGSYLGATHPAPQKARAS